MPRGLHLRVWADQLRLDRELGEGRHTHDSVAHELRVRQLSAHSARVELADRLQSAIEQLERPLPLRSTMPRVCVAAVRPARPALLALRARLEATEPVDVRGLALVSALVHDPYGPLYRHDDSASVEQLAREALSALEGATDPIRSG